MKSTKRFLIDLLERALSTFLQAFAATMGAPGVNLSIVDSLKISAGAGFLAVVKGFGGAKIGVQGTAALLPLSADAANAAVRTVTKASGKVINTITEPIPVVKQVGDVAEVAVERVGEVAAETVGVAADEVAETVVAVGGQAIEGATEVGGFIGRIFKRH